MTETVTARPAPGRRVRHPVTRQIMGDADVPLPRGSWLERRLADGDLVLAEAEAPAPHEAPAPPIAPRKTK